MVIDIPQIYIWIFPKFGYQWFWMLLHWEKEKRKGRWKGGKEGETSQRVLASDGLHHIWGRQVCIIMKIMYAHNSAFEVTFMIISVPTSQMPAVPAALPGGAQLMTLLSFLNSQFFFVPIKIFFHILLSITVILLMSNSLSTFPSILLALAHGGWNWTEHYHSLGRGSNLLTGW